MAACGGATNDHLAPIPPVTLNSRVDASIFNQGKDGGGDGLLQITIVQPAGGALLRRAISPELIAEIQSLKPGSFEPSGDPIDPTSVKYSIIPSKEKKAVLSGALFGPMAQARFSTRLDLSSLPTGVYVLTVAAASQSGAVGSASITIQIDAGPKITIVSPQESAHYKGSAVVQFLIDPAPLTLDAASVEALVGSTKIVVKPVGSNNAFEGPVKFEGFDPPLRGEQLLRVAAANTAGTRSEARVQFVVDTAGPVFAMTEPKEGSVVGGVIRVRARLTDPAGVLDPSVTAFIGNKTTVNFKLELAREAGEAGVYSAVFDTARLTTCRPLPDPGLCIVYPNLSFRASDQLGNESVVAYDIAVDNMPPLLDLDPPDIRISKFDTNIRKIVCSWSFDPVGNYRFPGDPPGDGCAVPQVFDLRARIEDQGNRADGLKIVPISGVDPATTGVYVLDDTNQPLVVDVDGDGVCDAINPNLVPTTTPPTASNQVLLVRLKGVEPQGSADFTPDLWLQTPEGLLAYPGCSPGVDPKAPTPLCTPHSIPMALGYPAANSKLPAIWALEPIVKNDPYCLGSQFDSYANEISEGWACVSAAAADTIGTGSVSPPIRVWIQRRGLQQTGPSCPAPPASAGPPPDCSGTYAKTTRTVSAVPCQARRYGPREVRGIEQ